MSQTDKRKVIVTKSEDKPESTEILAKSIVQISDGVKTLLESGLNRRALLVLLQDAIGERNISRKQIDLVLDNIPRLKGYYTKL